MTTRSLPLDRTQRAPPLLLIAGSAAAIGLGAASAWNARVALAVAVALALGVAFALRSATILVVMVGSVFIEVVTLGGVAVTRLVAPVAFVLLLVALIRGSAVVRFDAPLVWAAAYSLWALASALWTVSVGGTLFQLASLSIALAYMLGFAGLLASRAELDRVLVFLAVAALAIALFAIAAFVAGGSNDLQEGRAAGGTGDPNFFAAYQVVAVPLVLVLAGEVRRRWLRLGLYGSVLLLIASVLTTLSRGGLVALGAIVVLTLVLPRRTLFRSRGQKVVAVLATLVAAVVGFKAVSGTFTPRLDSMLSEGGGTGRLILWQGAWTGIKERPVTGLGYGAYPSASNDLVFRTPGVSLKSYDLHPEGQPAHSAYIGTAAELGIPGLLLFLGLLVSTGAALRRTAARARRAQAWFVMRVANALTISLAGWAVASLFLSSETSRPLWIVVGTALALPKLLHERPLSAREEAGNAIRLDVERRLTR